MHTRTRVRNARARTRVERNKMKNREITEHERKAYKHARNLYYSREYFEPINAKKEDTLTCWFYMRMVYYGFKTLNDDTSIPETIEKLEEWEKQNNDN